MNNLRFYQVDFAKTEEIMRVSTNFSYFFCSKKENAYICKVKTIVSS